jgi:rubrerythrin
MNKFKIKASLIPVFMLTQSAPQGQWDEAQRRDWTFYGAVKTTMNKGDIKMSQTEKNLKDAFAGESQANRKYLAFAEKADREGYRQVARLFRATAAAETVHAHAHLRALKGVGATADNLKAAISGETYEFESMYPAMIEAAKAEGISQAVQTFTFANEVEKIHAGLYQKALEKMADLEETDMYVCSGCGYTVEGEAPDECPVCKAKKEAFFKVD